MIYLVMILTAVSVALTIVAVTSLQSSQGRLVKQRLAALRVVEAGYVERHHRRARLERRQRVTRVMEALGTRLRLSDGRKAGVRTWLIHAGHRGPGAVAVFMATRILFAGGLGAGAFFATGLFELEAIIRWLLVAQAGLIGWMAPYIHVKRKAAARQLRIQKTIPDALDLLVVCVEAGLGLNQALLRVAQELKNIGPDLALELGITNLEIRAGTARAEALRDLGERSGVEDLRSLTSTLIQTDRFGTSIAHALRVHSDTLRTKRRQRAEEVAAKTTVKILFPLAVFVFPAVFVVLLGPAIFVFKELFGTLQ